MSDIAYYYGRIRDTNSVSLDGIALFPCRHRGRLKKCYVAFDGDPSGNWAAAVATVAGALATGLVIDGSSVGLNGIVEFDLRESDPNNIIHPGDYFAVSTTVGSGVAIPAGITMVIGR